MERFSGLEQYALQISSEEDTRGYSRRLALYVGVNSAILFKHLLRFCDKQGKGKSAAVLYSVEEFTKELSFGDKELYTAMRYLISAGLVWQERHGNPSRIYIFVNKENYIDMVSSLQTEEQIKLFKKSLKSDGTLSNMCNCTDTDKVSVPIPIRYLYSSSINSSNTDSVDNTYENRDIEEICSNYENRENRVRMTEKISENRSIRDSASVRERPVSENSQEKVEETSTENFADIFSPERAVTTTQRLEKTKNDHNSVLKELFDYWNSKKTYTHRLYTKYLEQNFSKAINKFTLQEIKDAIRNYSAVVNDADYFWTHKWQLEDFLKEENITNFSEEGKHWRAYKEDFIKKHPHETNWDVDKLNARMYGEVEQYTAEKSKQQNVEKQARIENIRSGKAKFI